MWPATKKTSIIKLTSSLWGVGALGGLGWWAPLDPLAPCCASENHALHFWDAHARTGSETHFIIARVENLSTVIPQSTLGTTQGPEGHLLHGGPIEYTV